MLCFARDDELQARARVLLVPFPRRGNAAGMQETPISSRDSTPDSDRGVDARTARPSRAPRASVPDGVGLGEPAIANAKSHRTETDPSPPPLRHTRPRRTQTHTMPKKRRANGRNKPAGARGHVRAPSPLRLSPTAIARATEPEPLGFLDRRADLRGDRAGPGAAREDARSGHRADYVLCHASGC